MRTIEEFTERISKRIKQYTLIEYGCIGSQYLKVLTVKDGKIVVIGELVYVCFREYFDASYMPELLDKLGDECQKYIDGKRDTIPSLHSRENKLTVR